MVPVKDKTYYHHLIPRTWLRPEKELKARATELPLIFPSYEAEGSVVVPTGFIYVMLKRMDTLEEAQKRFEKHGLEVVRLVITHHGAVFTVRSKHPAPVDDLFSLTRALHEDPLVEFASSELQRVRD